MASLSVLLLTYNRLDYATKTICSTLDNLKFKGKLCVHIADDGSKKGYVDTLKKIVGGYANVECITSSNSEHRGYGANYNLALQTVHRNSEYILPLEDDWRLERTLDIDNLIEALNEEVFGCIRLGYLGFTQDLKGRLVYCANNHYLLLDANSAERHIFAGHPRLETIQWQRKLGVWPEGLDPNKTEFSVAGRPESRNGVAWPLDLIKPSGDLFSHIGAERAR